MKMLISFFYLAIAFSGSVEKKMGTGPEHLMPSHMAQYAGIEASTRTGVLSFFRLGLEFR